MKYSPVAALLLASGTTRAINMKGKHEPVRAKRQANTPRELMKLGSKVDAE